MKMALLEARPYRPFKSSEEYLEAMKEDLAEWLNTLYPELIINAENFMDRLDTGVALCKHANNVRQAAKEYLSRRQARNKSMTRSITSGSAGPILAMGNIHYLPAAKSGTFFARDNVSNFITWCRRSLKIIECLLFETDDLIMRKNEKHVILCLLEVARRGAKFGMLAPMLVQMERQIDREIAADNKINGIACGIQTDNNVIKSVKDSDSIGTKADESNDSDSENDDGCNDGDSILMYGPKPQIVTNDLKSLDEMVRDLVEQCTCPSQFPMVRVSEGKYRIGDTKVLIFVRILRSHVMVRVGGGWDTLSHYLDKHDPCRCKAQHRTVVGARLIPKSSNENNGIELNRAQVIFERSSPSACKIISNLCNHMSGNHNIVNSNNQPMVCNVASAISSHYGITNKTPRSHSPTTKQKVFYQNINNHITAENTAFSGTTATNNISRKPAISVAHKLKRRSVSPRPRSLMDKNKKDICNNGQKSLSATAETQIYTQTTTGGQSNAEGLTNTSNKFENISDNCSEISDEGYRSLGIIQSNIQKRGSLHSQASVDDVEYNARHNQAPRNFQMAPTEDITPINKICDVLQLDDSPRSLPIILSNNDDVNNIFEQSGVLVTEDDITVDVDGGTCLNETQQKTSNTATSKIPFLQLNTIERKRLNNSGRTGSLQDLQSHAELPTLNRNKPAFRSVRKPNASILVNKKTAIRQSSATTKKTTTDLWSERHQNECGSKRSTPKTEAFSTNCAANEPAFKRTTTRSSQILRDSKGRRVKGGGTTSLTTSPVKNHVSSPLAVQLLEAASSAKNDAQILEKMKTLLLQYSTSNYQIQASSSNNSRSNLILNPNTNSKKPYEDFTAAWVNSNGNLERSNSCSSTVKANSKLSSAASSTESTYSREMSVIVSPRRDRGISKIPAPVRQHTELY